LRDVLGQGKLSIVANVGDNLMWHGLLVCPDLDSVAYALAGLWDSERGWGLRDETFRVRDTLADLHERPWFNVGDRDLALHLLRTDHLRSGYSLTDATQELSRRLGITSVEMLPASDESNETYVLLEDGRLLHFQEWYVRERADPELREVRLAGGVASKAAVHALQSADAVILGPSNPITSIGAILALDGIEEAIRSAPRRIAVSPVGVGIESNNAGVRHHALARRRALTTVGRTDTPGAIANLYTEIAELFLIDDADARDAEEVWRARLEPVQADLLDPAALARTLADLCT
jgi:LPPG:FO 2-phospho-L-lactate transferase